VSAPVDRARRRAHSPADIAAKDVARHDRYGPGLSVHRQGVATLSLDPLDVAMNLDGEARQIIAADDFAVHGYLLAADGNRVTGERPAVDDD